MDIADGDATNDDTNCTNAQDCRAIDLYVAI